MSDQILDEDEVLKGGLEIGPSFWSDFRYFVWAFIFGMGMVYFWIYLLYFIYEYPTRHSLLEGQWTSEYYYTIAVEQADIFFPLSFLFMLVMTWFLNRKTNDPKVLKYIYSVLGILCVHLLLTNDLLNNLVYFKFGGPILGMLLIAWSVFMLRRQGD